MPIDVVIYQATHVGGGLSNALAGRIQVQANPLQPSLAVVSHPRLCLTSRRLSTPRAESPSA